MNRFIRYTLLFSLSLLPTISFSEEKKPVFDQSDWDKFLKTYVDDQGWVDYAAIQKSGQTQLKNYLKRLSSASLSKFKTQAEQVSFWVNAYNAITIQKLLDHKLPKKVPNAVIFGKNIFKERTYKVAGKIRSLDDIEHGILRKKYKEPRVHAALVCGASSCPRLRPEAYTSQALDKQLTEEAQRWIRSGRTLKGDRKNYLNRKTKTMYVSKIFDWFDDDFGGTNKGILQFIKKFASEDDRKFLNSNKIRIRYLDYDWTLNRKKGKK